MRLHPYQLASASYLLMEAFAWYVVLHVVGTAVAREAFGMLVRDLQRGSADLLDPDRVQRALVIARAGLESASGPSVLLVLTAALGAFLFMRWIRQIGLPIEFAAPIGIIVTIVAFHVLLHVAVAHDLRIWESSAIIQLVSGDARGSEAIDVTAFLARPDPASVRYAADIWVAMGLILMWFRFMVAGRGEVDYDRALRSFGAGFGALLATAFFGGMLAGVQISGLIIVYFVLGIITLALAHAARTAGTDAITSRSTPWLASLVVTVSALAALALLLGLLALLDLGRLFAPAVSFLLDIIGTVVVWVLSPVIWVLRVIIVYLLGRADFSLLDRLRDLDQEIVRPASTREGPLIPPWIFSVFQSLVLAGAIWLVYRVGRVLFRRVHRMSAAVGYAELREGAGAWSGGSLLGGLFRGRRPASGFDGSWLRQQPVYRLYARLVGDARQRGLERALGDTPIEFARDVGGRLHAPPFGPIGEAFDRARYGRHFPEASDLDTLEAALSAWERDHPAGGRRS